MSQGDSVYKRCHDAYPTVGWDSASFFRHLDGRIVPHTEDLYLAGAAGYRLNSAWELIERDKSGYVIRTLETRPLADYTVADLWADTRTRLKEERPRLPLLPDGRRCARILTYEGQVKLEAFMVTVAKRLAISRQRAKKPAVVDFSAKSEGGTPKHQHADDTIAPDEAAVAREEQELMFSAVVEVFRTLDVRERLVLKLMWIGGLNQKQAAQQMNEDAPAGKTVREYTVSRILSSIRERFEAAIRQKLGGEPTLESLRRAGEVIGVLLKDDEQ